MAAVFAAADGDDDMLLQYTLLSVLAL